MLAPFQSQERLSVRHLGCRSGRCRIYKDEDRLALPPTIAEHRARCRSLMLSREGEESTRPISLAKFLFPREVYLHRSAIVELQVCRNLISPSSSSSTLRSLPASACSCTSAAAAPFAGLSALDLPLEGVLVGTIAIPILAIVVADFGFFLSHYLMRKIPEYCGASMKSITRPKSLRR